MKLVTFTYTNDIDNQSEVRINPAFVVSLRPLGTKANTKTVISLASKAEVTVDGSIDQVANALGTSNPDAVANAKTEDYDQAKQTTEAVDRMVESG